jgi:sterol desaturase/sphingolipid hydroxylase (fatty acid hydroxylase superfamily)
MTACELKDLPGRLILGAWKGHMNGTLHIVLCLTASIVIAELLGYALHRLLHSGTVRFLSHSHMKHHLLLYGPLQKQRSKKYRDATCGRPSLGNIGLEWLLPATLLIGSMVTVFHFFHVLRSYQLLSLATVLVWSFLMFSYLHDVMHVEGFWMAGAPLFRDWFVRARRLHDIHHHALNDEGFMDKNFGIGFFAFDRLFGTLAHNLSGFNHQGYAAAQEKFPELYDDDRPAFV